MSNPITVVIAAVATAIAEHIKMLGYRAWLYSVLNAYDRSCLPVRVDAGARAFLVRAEREEDLDIVAQVDATWLVVPSRKRNRIGPRRAADGR
jgi:hypothetical protein